MYYKLYFIICIIIAAIIIRVVWSRKLKKKEKLDDNEVEIVNA